jgi:hypothetical protein
LTEGNEVEGRRKPQFGLKPRIVVKQSPFFLVIFMSREYPLKNSPRSIACGDHE